MTHWSDAHREYWDLDDFDDLNGIMVPHSARLIWAQADDDAIFELPDHRLPPSVIRAMEEILVYPDLAACEHVQAANAAGTASMIEKVLVRGLRTITCGQIGCVIDSVNHSRIQKTLPDEGCVICGRGVFADNNFRCIFHDQPQALSLVCWVCDRDVHGPLARWAGVKE